MPSSPYSSTSLGATWHVLLTKTLVSFTSEEVSAQAVAAAFSTFLKIFLGSSAIGLAFGALSALTFKHLKLFDHLETVFLEVALSFTFPWCHVAFPPHPTSIGATWQVVLSFTFPWAAFFLAEALELSGIVAILFCGTHATSSQRSPPCAPHLPNAEPSMHATPPQRSPPWPIMWHTRPLFPRAPPNPAPCPCGAGMVFATYTRINVPEDGLLLMAGAYKCVAKIAETFVFVYLGMAFVRSHTGIEACTSESERERERDLQWAWP